MASVLKIQECISVKFKLPERGKSTLYNFVGPVANRVCKKINDTNSHPLAELIPAEYEGEFVAKKPKNFKSFPLLFIPMPH